MTYDISQGQNYECYKHSVMNILDLKMKIPSIIFMTDFRRDLHVFLYAIGKHVHFCIWDSIHQKQYTQTLGTALNLQSNPFVLLSGTVVSVMIMAKWNPCSSHPFSGFGVQKWPNKNTTESCFP